MVLAIPTRNIKRALRYWYPKRLTLKCNPGYMLGYGGTFKTLSTMKGGDA